jgi:hypothetical protein
MPFDKEAEENEWERGIELIFQSGKPKSSDDLSLGPSAYIAMGWHTRDSQGRPMLTSKEMSFGALKGQVDYIKMCLDARLAEAKAQFAAAGVDV